MTQMNRATVIDSRASRNQRQRRRTAVAVITAAAAASAFTGRVDALNKSWKAVNNWSSWNISSNWSPLGQPQDADSVSVVNTTATERGVYYVNTSFPDAMLTNFTLDGIGGATMNFSQQSSAYYSLG